MSLIATRDIAAFSFNDLSALRRAHPDNVQMFTRLGFPAFEQEGRARSLEYFMMLDERDRVIAMTGMENLGIRSTCTRGYGVDPKYREQGIARQLVRRVFEHMAQTGDVLEPSRYTPMGMKSLLHVEPQVHQEFPDVLVRWDYSSPITGHRPYRIGFDADKDRYPIYLPAP